MNNFRILVSWPEKYESDENSEAELLLIEHVEGFAKILEDKYRFESNDKEPGAA